MAKRRPYTMADVDPAAGGPPLPSAADWQQPEVMGDAVTGGPASAVSGFIRNGVPQLAAREAATARALDQLKKLTDNFVKAGKYTPEQAAGIMQTAADYPRVMAHQSGFSAIPEAYKPGLLAQLADFLGIKEIPPNGYSGLYTPDTWAAHRGRGSIQLSPVARNPENTFTHELTHGAQGVALKRKFLPAYRAESKAKGYWLNKYEQGADKAAQKRWPVE